MANVYSHPYFLTPQRLQPDCPLFIFLPGLDGTGQLLRSQAMRLEAEFDVRCLAIPQNDWSNWSSLAEKVIELVKAEVAAAPNRLVYLCGESFGGCLAMKVALHDSQLFDQIILVNPASSFGSTPWIAWGSQMTSWLPESIYQLSSLAFLPFLAYLGRIAEGDRQALIETVRVVPQKTSAWRLTLLNQFQISEAELQQLTQPVLLLASAADRLLPSLLEAERLASFLPNAQVVALPNSGHACLLERSVNLYEIMRSYRFLPNQKLGSQPDTPVASQS